MLNAGLEAAKGNRLSENMMIGYVINNNDPERLQRVKVRVASIHRNVPDEQLPWAISANASGHGAGPGLGTMIVPAVNSTVFVRMLNDDPHFLIYESAPATGAVRIPDLEENYPNTYGWADPAGNLIRINTQTKVMSVIHSSGCAISIAANGAVTVTSPNSINLLAQQDIMLQAKGAVNVHTKTSLNIFAASDIVAYVSGNLIVNSAHEIFLKAATNIRLHAVAAIELVSTAAITLMSAAGILFKGSTVSLNPTGSSASPPTAPSAGTVLEPANPSPRSAPTLTSRANKTKL